MWGKQGINWSGQKIIGEMGHVYSFLSNKNLMSVHFLLGLTTCSRIGLFQSLSDIYLLFINAIYVYIST